MSFTIGYRSSLPQTVFPAKRIAVQQPPTQSVFETQHQPKPSAGADSFQSLYFGMNTLKKKTSRLLGLSSPDQTLLIPKPEEELKKKYGGKMKGYFSDLQNKWDLTRQLGELSSKIPKDMIKIIYFDKQDEAIENVKHTLKDDTNNEKDFGAVLVIPRKKPKDILNLPGQSKVCQQDESFNTTTAVFRAGKKDKKLLYIITNNKNESEKLKKVANAQFESSNLVNQAIHNFL